jgi:DNA-binding HxlR family transcriptional regulator
MPGISQKMLSVTLRSLVADGLAWRRVATGVPPSVYYRLTDLGLSLETPLAACAAGPRSTWPRSTALTGKRGRRKAKQRR